MTKSELQEKIADLIYKGCEALEETPPADQIADRILAIPEIAEALEKASVPTAEDRYCDDPNCHLRYVPHGHALVSDATLSGGIELEITKALARPNPEIKVLRDPPLERQTPISTQRD